ncbi:Polyadenylate-binding protein-interacting protein 2 [Hirschfeldia incana]|nr:Polyadenylate-binding protein-interacting protein 2 [Hirschfeldia incana]
MTVRSPSFTSHMPVTHTGLPATSFFKMMPNLFLNKTTQFDSLIGEECDRRCKNVVDGGRSECIIDAESKRAGVRSGGIPRNMEDEFEELIVNSPGEAEMGGSAVRELDVGRYLKVLLSMAAESTKVGKVYRSDVSCSAKYNQKKKMNPNFYCRRNHHIYQPR